jgi:hypothetical protein
VFELCLRLSRSFLRLFIFRPYTAFLILAEVFAISARVHNHMVVRCDKIWLAVAVAMFDVWRYIL